MGRVSRRTKRRTNRKKNRSIKRSIKRDLEKSLRKTIERSIKKSLTTNSLWSRLTISQVRDFMAFANSSSSEVSYMDWAFGKRFLQDKY